jgi:hypothetical protein
VGKTLLQREISTIKKMRDKKTSFEEKIPPIREKKRKIDQVTSPQCRMYTNGRCSKLDVENAP